MMASRSGRVADPFDLLKVGALFFGASSSKLFLRSDQRALTLTNFLYKRQSVNKIRFVQLKINVSRHNSGAYWEDGSMSWR